MRGIPTGWMVLAVVVVLLIAYRYWSVQRVAETAAQMATETPAPHGTGPAGGDARPGSPTDLAEVDLSQFASDGQYDPVTSRQADVDGDGMPEWVALYQCASRDDMGMPTEPPYVQVIGWDERQRAWEALYDIPGERQATAVDEASLLAVGNLDGQPGLEVVLRAYGFGVSSRGEYVYIHHLRGESADPAMVPMPLETSSDDTVVLDDARPDLEGEELLVARALLGDEAHAAPHRYLLETYGWQGGFLELMGSRKTAKAYENGALALQEEL